MEVVRLNVHERSSRPLIGRFGAHFTPTFILLDSSGQEVWRRVGPLRAGEVRQVVNELSDE